jgi:hypothetical protein
VVRGPLGLRTLSAPCTPIRILALTKRLDLTPGEQEGAAPSAAMGFSSTGLSLPGTLSDT